MTESEETFNARLRLSKHIKCREAAANVMEREREFSEPVRGFGRKEGATAGEETRDQMCLLISAADSAAEGGMRAGEEGDGREKHILTQHTHTLSLLQTLSHSQASLFLVSRKRDAREKQTHTLTFLSDGRRKEKRRRKKSKKSRVAKTLASHYLRLLSLPCLLSCGCQAACVMRGQTVRPLAFDFCRTLRHILSAK